MVAKIMDGGWGGGGVCKAIKQEGIAMQMVKLNLYLLP